MTLTSSSKLNGVFGLLRVLCLFLSFVTSVLGESVELSWSCSSASVLVGFSDVLGDDARARRVFDFARRINAGALLLSLIVRWVELSLTTCPYPLSLLL